MQQITVSNITPEELLTSIRLLIKEELGLKFNESETKVEYITGDELCAYIGISKPTLIRYRKKGRIPFIEMGGVLRYDKNKVAKALELGNKKGDTKK